MLNNYTKPALNVHRFLMSGLMLVFLLFLCAPAAFSQQDRIAELRAQLKGAQHDSLKVELLMDLSRRLQYQESPRETEYECAQKAIDLALEIKDTLLYARALDNLGLLYRYGGNYGQSIPLHIKAYKLVADKDNVRPLYKMIFANNAGVALRYHQQYALSVAYYLNALKIAEREHDLKNIAISSNGMGNALSNIPGKEAEAMTYLKRALRAERERGNKRGIAMDLLSISGHYINKGDFENAFLYLDSLYANNKSRGDEYGIAITYQFYGNAYLAEGKQLDKAETYYRKALSQFKAMENFGRVAELLKKIGNLHYKNGESQQAFQYYLQSLQVADSLNNKRLISENAYALSRIKQQQNDYAGALSYYKKANNYEDSVALIEQKVKIAALTNQYELEKKENKITNLELVNQLNEKRVEVQQQKIKNHKMYFGILISVLFGVLFFIYLQYKTVKAKRKAVDLLHEKREELLKSEYEKNIAQAEMLASRAQLNPHFLSNCMTGVHLFLQKGEVKKADEYLIVLSRFLRMLLEISRSETISLEEEFELIKYYVTLEEKRFGEGFVFEIEALPSKEMKAIDIPPLLLQPFVENAIWHGLMPSEKTVKKLRIEMCQQAGNIQIAIEDNGVGRSQSTACHAKESQQNKKSMGMQITRDRIRQFNSSYNKKIDFEILDLKEDYTGKKLGTKVVISIKGNDQKN